MKKWIVFVLMMLMAMAALCNTAFAVTMPDTTEYRCSTCTRNNGGYESSPIEWTVTTWTLQDIVQNDSNGRHKGIYTCDVCGMEINMLPGEHEYIDYWPEGKPIDGYTPGRWCEVCGYIVLEPQKNPEHSFTDRPSDQLVTPANCYKSAVYYVQCDDCDEISFIHTVSVGEPLGHDYGAWEQMENGYRHSATCQRCMSATTYGDCSGGTATCAEKAKCEFCGGEYGDYGPHSFTNRPSTQWASAATCTEAQKYYAQCDNCNEVSDTVTVAVGESLGHDYSGRPATCTEPQVCAREGCETVLEEAKGHDYSGAPATCTEPQVCARDGCDAVLEEAKGHDYSGAPATCTEPQVCAREGCETVLEEAKGHDYSGTPATCTEPQVCARQGCGAVLEEAKGHDYSGTPATCTEPQVCARDGCNAVLEEAKGHDYKTSVTAPTCTRGGYTTYTCSNCKHSYTADATSARGHYFGIWTFNGDNTHSALCKRTGCEHTGTVACEWFDWQLFMRDVENAPEYAFTFCPVCGEVSDGARLLLVEMVKAEALTEKLPGGEIVLRKGELANGEAVMSVGFEYGGELTQPTGEVKVTISAMLLDGYTLALLDADGVESDLPFTVEDEELSFTLDFTPVEDEEPIPVRVIRLIPIAE